MERLLVFVVAALAPLAALAAGPAVGRRHTPPPTAAFTSSPADPATGSPVDFNGSASTCPAGKCTYYYHDIGSSGTADWPLIGPQSSASGNFTFSTAGTKYVQLVV